LLFSYSATQPQVWNKTVSEGTNTHSARNLSFIFDEHLTFSAQISSLSKFCYSHIRQLRCIRPYLDSKTQYHRFLYCAL